MVRIRFHARVLGGAAALALGTACISPEAHMQVRAANDDLQRQLADLERYQGELDAENQRLRAEVQRLGRTAADAAFVKQQKDELARLLERLGAGAPGAIPGVDVIRTDDGLAFQMQGEVLFQSGKAEITPEGRATLAQLVPFLRESARQLRVDGHTDSDPIRHSQWKTNLRLSAERGMAVYQFLVDSGIDPLRCYVAAFGEHRPAVAGTTPADKRKNRRVEITMLGQ